eukprot:2361574-Amphidinium_carterae.1
MKDGVEQLQVGACQYTIANGFPWSSREYSPKMITSQLESFRELLACYITALQQLCLCSRAQAV